MQTGQPFPIFQDRNDLRWGQHWKSRIDDALLDVTFLIPVVTPSFFRSPACKKEFDTFLVRENALGEDRLILPIYYVSSDEMEGPADPDNVMATVLKARNWADWRNLRFEPPSSSAVQMKVETLARHIKAGVKELNSVFATSDAKKIEVAPVPKVEVVASSRGFPTPAYNPAVVFARGDKFDESSLRLAQTAPYFAYTRKYDEVITPSEVSEPADTIKLHSELMAYVREEVAAYEPEISLRTQEIANVGQREKLAVAFLIDNSGSMRGPKIKGVASGMSVISSILSNANVSCEILGFTTRAWRGGQSRELWMKDGKPASPGRLNDLRHIIYKSFEEISQEADINLSVMLRVGLLKENVDGEALLWAYSRLTSHPAERKLLFVLSDGAPVDDSTLSANDLKFLDGHARTVISWIKHRSDVELYGVGIDHDVSGFYGAGSPALVGGSIGPDLLRVVSFAISRSWSDAAAIRLPSPPEKKKRKRK